MSYWQDQQPEDPRRKRTGPNEQIKFIRFSGFLSWMLIALSALLIDSATPRAFNIYVLDEKWGKSSEVYFIGEMMIAAGITCLVAFILISISVYIDSKYQNRDGDHFSYALLFGLIVNTAMLVFFGIYFFG